MFKFGITDQPVIDIKVGSHRVRVLCDTGSDLNLMSARTAEKLNIRLKEVKFKIKTANGSEMLALG